jgi:hypothetical protein
MLLNRATYALVRTVAGSGGQFAWLVGFGFVALGGSSRHVWKGAKFEIVVGRIKLGELVEPVM